MDIYLEPNSLLLPQFCVTMVLLGATGTAMKNWMQKEATSLWYTAVMTITNAWQR